MVGIQNVKMTLTQTMPNVTIRVQYNAAVNPLERHMCANGMQLGERFVVYGIDPTATTLLHNFPLQYLPVTPGAVTQNIARDRTLTVTRASLQEDAGLGDADEIRCKVIVSPVWLPVSAENWSNQEVLPG